MGLVFIGMETSGELRRRFQAAGHETYSCDVLPSEDGGEDMAYCDGLPMGRHIVGDVFETLENMWANDLWPDLAIFHPSCTYLTNSAEWAFADPDYERYPGVGYHQRVQPGTLTGSARREARAKALEDVRRIMALPIRRKAIENPVGAIGTAIRKSDQVVQPFHYGDDASKATCLWLEGLPKLRPTKFAEARWVPRALASGKSDRALSVDDCKTERVDLFGVGLMRWSNQTDAGQNRLSPSADRWKERSRTYPGIATAMVDQWASLL